MFVGQVARHMREREAFQELDYRAVFGTMTKWATEIDDPNRVPEIVSRAFHVAANGRPGPVVVALPEDMLTERVAIADAPPYLPVETAPGRAEMDAFAALLAKAERPLFVLGGSRWTEEGCAAIARFAEKFGVPIATSFRRAHLMHALHPSYAGDLGIGPNPKLLARVKATDLIVLLGGRLSEMPSQGYKLFDIPTPQMTLVVSPGYRGAWARLSAKPCDQCDACGVCNRGGRARTAGDAAMASRDQGRARGVSRPFG